MNMNQHVVLEHRVLGKMTYGEQNIIGTVLDDDDYFLPSRQQVHIISHQLLLLVHQLLLSSSSDSPIPTSVSFINSTFPIKKVAKSLTDKSLVHPPEIFVVVCCILAMKARLMMR